MTDIFDQIVVCRNCGRKMRKGVTNKEGFEIRTFFCEKCKKKIYHPADIAEYKQFLSLKKKPFHVKLRIVGNSYAISIPKEIIQFIKEQEKLMDEMVSLSMEEAGKISLLFKNLKKSL